MDKKKTLKDIFNDDEFGILNEPDPKYCNVKSEDERLIESFQEINSFFEKNNREPGKTSITEQKLLFRLNALRQDQKKIEVLQVYDIYNLLKQREEVKSVADILNDDDLGILDTEETLSIFKLKNVPNSMEREEADFVARRKPMKDKEFMSYDSMFKKVHQELKKGRRKIVAFKEYNLQEGVYYVMDGLLLYLESVNIDESSKTLPSGDRIWKDGRTLCVFENGTKSNMLYRSLSKRLYENGKVITHNADTDNAALLNNSNAIVKEDLETGWIYVLKSKSTHTEIASLENLYKIGYSNVNVNQRIKNASKEPTYLNADVQIISTYKCYNVNPRKFEQLLHRFFAEACLDVDITDDKGRRITPREWFVVPLPIIDKVINRILSGEIIKYRYDSVRQLILKRSR